MEQPPPQNPQLGPPPPGWTAPATKTNTLAIVSLACGVLCWVALPLVGAVAAVVTGHMARREIRRTGEDGDFFALIGMISGYVHLALGVVVILILVAVFGGLALLLGTSHH